MQTRFIELVDYVVSAHSPWIDLERITGISRESWRKSYTGKQRITEGMIEAVGRHWPRYVYWLVTGKTNCTETQSAPSIDKALGYTISMQIKPQQQPHNVLDQVPGSEDE